MAIWVCTEIYDPAEDRWEPGPELLSPLTAAQAVSLAGELWLLRGHGSNSYNDKVDTASVSATTV